MAITYSNEHAKHSLRASKRRSLMTTLAVALVFAVGVFLWFSFWLLSSYRKDAPIITPMKSPSDNQAVVMEEELEFTPQDSTTSSAAAPPAPNLIKVNVLSSIGVPDVSVDTNLVNFGQAENSIGSLGLGDMLSTDTGLVADFNFSSPFGSPGASKGRMVGQMYDLKRTRSGRIKEDYLSNPSNNFMGYVEPVREMMAMAMRGEDLSEFPEAYTVGEPLSANTMLVPILSTLEGPKSFGADGKMDPKGWMVHYKSKIKAPRSGKFRFMGKGDDMIAVLINSKPVFDGSHASIRYRLFDSTGLPETRVSAGYHGAWIDVRKGEILDFDLFVGEDPGGKMQFSLMVEWEKLDLKVNSSGKAIYQVFAMQPLVEEEIKYIEETLGKERFQLEDIYTFGAD